MAAGKMRSTWPTGAKRGVSSLKWLSYFLVIAFVNVSFTTSLEVSINEDFYQQDEINPCDFMSIDSPPGYCFCSANDVSTAESAKCGFHRTPNEKEWNAISLLHNVNDFEVSNRPQLVITEVPPDYVFKGMKRLHYFTIKMAALHNIPSYAFANSTSLIEIDMQSNNIHSLSSHSFSNLHNLTKIKLNDNNLTEINRDVFVDLPKLKELWLMTNGIQVIHDNALQELKALKDLSFRDNRVSVITREVFYGLQRLENLDLHGNAIEYVGDHAFAEMPRLQDLDLSENMIKSVSPNAFQGLAKLTRLSIKDNKIVRFQPTTFAHLGKIHILDLKNNELETLSEALVRPIIKNLRNGNMQLFLDGNRFLCNCHILWMKALYNETESPYVRKDIEGATCNLFETTSKQDAAVASPSSTIFHTEDAASEIKILTSPPEETTKYAFDSEKYILNLTAKDLNCHERDDGVDNGRDKIPRRKHDGIEGHRRNSQHTSTFHHQQSIPKLAEESGHEQGHKHKHQLAVEWDPNSESHQRDHGGGISSEENLGVHSGTHGQHSSLNEPQATAALEGADVSGSAPKRMSTGEQKVDTSRISSNYPDNASAGAKISNCDLRFLIIIAVSICISLILK